MLVAYGPDGQPVTADEIPSEQVRAWSRERLLYCPNCRGTVHVRGGADKRTQLHFAHQKGECAWSTETESVRHARGKMVLAQWLRDQFSQATITLEERLPEPNRIADVFVAHPNGQHWAIEFQCAPLDIEEWQKRHTAYRAAGIFDLWIIGNNRREKQEAFIEAILATAHEIMFLDPQVTPPRTWLRWPVTRATAQQLQEPITIQPAHGYAPVLDGWVGRTGYGVTILGSLPEIRLDAQGHLVHATRQHLEARTKLLQAMETATTLDEKELYHYMRSLVDEEALRMVIIPLLHAYRRDPDLLRRYNYGRGLENLSMSESDRQRVQKACQWLTQLAQHGFSPERLRSLFKNLPFAGPYAAFARYAELLLALQSLH